MILLERIPLGNVVLVSGLKQFACFLFLQLARSHFATGNLGYYAGVILANGREWKKRTELFPVQVRSEACLVNIVEIPLFRN